MASSTKRKIAPGLTWVAPKTYESRVTAVGPTGKKADKERTHHNIPNDRAAIKAHEAFRDEVTAKARVSAEWTVAQAIDSYEPTQTFGTQRARKVHMKRFRAAFGERTLSSVSPAQWQRWFSELPASLSTISVNLHVDTIRQVYAHAAGKGRLLGDNTASKIQRRRDVFDEAQAYRDAEDGEPVGKALLGDNLSRVMDLLQERYPELYPLCRTQLVLGLRFGEAAALQWNDINWDTGLVTIRRAVQAGSRLTLPKNKKKRQRVTSLGPNSLAFMRGHRAAVERSAVPGWNLWCFPRQPRGMGPRPPAPQIFDRSMPPLPGVLWAYECARAFLRDVFDTLKIPLSTTTHAFRHTHATLTEGYASDAIGRSVQLEMTGHGEQARKGYVDRSAYEPIAIEFGQRLDRALMGMGGGQSGTPPRKLHKTR